MWSAWLPAFAPPRLRRDADAGAVQSKQVRQSVTQVLGTDAMPSVFPPHTRRNVAPGRRRRHGYAPRPMDTTSLLADHVVLVSGVGPGLGRACARVALAAGARVALGDLDAERVASIAAALDPSGDRVVPHRLDITDEGSIDAMVRAVDARWGRVDGLVHVAALDTVVGGLLDGDLDDWDRVSAVNVRGTLALTRAVTPCFVDGGSVVVIGSIGAVRPRGTSLRMAYGISKGALVTAARYLAVELGPRRVRVNTVAPGWKWGPVLEGYLRGVAASSGRPFEELVDEIRADSPMHDIADDDDVADTVLYFLSPLSRKVSGQIVHVDAGSYLP